MLVRRTVNDLVYYSSPLLTMVGVPHGFSTRLGGISPAPFDSLNLGNPSGFAVQDDEPRIVQNYQRFQSAIGAADRQRFWVHQVHAGDIVTADLHSQRGQKADGIVTREARLAIAIRIADCVPILLSSEDGQTVAAVHAGWRGVIAGVVAAAIDRMAVVPTKLIAAIGPCISFDAFEVGPEVLLAFEKAFPTAPPVLSRPDGKGQVDLREAVRRQLLTAGIAADHIDSTDRCTFRDADEFFSHRRENGVTGRLAAIIATK